MMRRMITAAAIATAVGTCGIANAQQKLDYYPNNFTIRAGVAIPLDSSFSNVSNTFYDLGLEYNFNNSLFKGGETYLSVDGFFNTMNSVDAYPVAINQRFYTGRNAAGRRSYYFVGVGMTFISVTNATYEAISGRAGIGTELGPNIIAELAGYISDEAGGARANAITLDLGYRF